MTLRATFFKSAKFLGTSVILWSAFSPAVLGRDVLLNGQDISSARNQELKGVNLRIDDKGNLFIEAPQYRVHEEDTYTPLSRFVKDAAKDNKSAGIPPHQGPRPLALSPQTGDQDANRDMVPASPDIPLIQNETDGTTAAVAPGSAPAEKTGAKSPVAARRTAQKSRPAPDSSEPSREKPQTADAAPAAAADGAVSKKVGLKAPEKAGSRQDSTSQDPDSSPTAGE